MTSFLWLVALVVGGIGGALNAVLSDHARLLPSIVTLTPGGTRVVRVGIVGNIVTGAMVALCLFWAIQGAGSTLNANGGLGLVLLGLSNLFISFVSARWVTNEVDKLVLRKAVFKAASAPAAHPDTVDQMALAPPYALYTLADRLLPRRTGHR
ncbi:MAG TPA: hypothetical protein VFB92_24455 [Vicinamibacterales bacterium]|jgi:hypothetical protein|nr:hypothetical protein [Vicinamibacterales bacterium]